VQNGSRAAVLSAVFLLLWTVGHRFVPRIGIPALCAAIFVAQLGTFTGAVDGALRLVDAGTIRGTGDLAGRLTSWPLARQLFEEHFIVGVGAGGFPAINPYRIGAHNLFLELGTGLGLLGIVLFVGTVFTALVRSTRTVEPRFRNLVIGSLLAAWAPIYLSGHWELSAAAWVAIALFSRITVLAGERKDTEGKPTDDAAS
jgi:O-antigen ligase